MSAALSAATADLIASADAVRENAGAALRAATGAAVTALKAASPAYPYKYAERIAASAKATKPREKGDTITAQVKIGGRKQAFSGGASVSELVWGAEYGAKGGDVVRIRTSNGRSQTVVASRFGDARARAAAKGHRITGVRAGGLPQFPARNTDGYFLTPALDAHKAGVWDEADRLFTAALEG